MTESQFFYCNCNLSPFSNIKAFLDLSILFLISGQGATHIHPYSHYIYIPIVITHTFPQKEGMLISPQPDLLPDVGGRNRQCLWKEGSVHVPNCKYFLVTEAERKHVRRRKRFQQHRDASCHQIFIFPCKARRRRTTF